MDEEKDTGSPSAVRRLKGALALKRSFFWAICVSLAVIYGIVKWIIPFASRRLTGMPFQLPVPGTLMLFYMSLAVAALFLYVTFSEEGLDEFTTPVKAFLAGDYGAIPRGVVLGLIPVFVGWQIYDMSAPKTVAPAALRIQHPSSNFPKKMEGIKNPFANPSDADVNAFIEQAKSGKVEFVAQVKAEMEAWKEANPKGHQLAFIPTEPMVRFLKELSGGKAGMDASKAALIEKNLFEGRGMYAMNCRPCHGDSTAGDGPMADGFKLRPIDFTDNGTIETIVEGYTFWRISTGGLGLPIEATPWDSAMPVWGQNLTEDERWKIMMAEYDMSQKTPRLPEKH